VPSRSPYAPAIRFSAAVRAGDLVVTAGLTAMDQHGVIVGGDDPYLQALEILRKIRGTLEQAGTTIDRVIQTRMYLTRAADWEAVGRAHADFFADIRPVTTMLVIGLLDERLLVEIEAVAAVGS
jgi:enamine deaminase RidA (YjgF/YER057c/UK114 family)